MEQKIELGHVVFAVKEMPDLCNTDGDPLAGQLDGASCEIRIGSTHPQYRQEALWHEVVHLILGMAERVDDSKNEDLVVALSGYIVEALYRNPILREITDWG